MSIKVSNWTAAIKQDKQWKNKGQHFRDVQQLPHRHRAIHGKWSSCVWFTYFLSVQMNDGPLCKCSAKARRTGIRHSIYPGEEVWHAVNKSPFHNLARRGKDIILLSLNVFSVHWPFLNYIKENQRFHHPSSPKKKWWFSSLRIRQESHLYRWLSDYLTRCSDFLVSAHSSDTAPRCFIIPK